MRRTRASSGHKSEAWVVLRVPEHDDVSVAEQPRAAQRRLDEASAEALPLVRWQDREGCKTETPRVVRAVDSDRAEQDVADDGPALAPSVFRRDLCDQRNDCGSRAAHGVDHRSLFGALERLAVDLGDLRGVLGPVIPHAAGTRGDWRLAQLLEKSVVLDRYHHAGVPLELLAKLGNGAVRLHPAASEVHALPFDRTVLHVPAVFA